MTPDEQLAESRQPKPSGKCSNCGHYEHFTVNGQTLPCEFKIEIGVCRAGGEECEDAILVCRCDKFEEEDISNELRTGD